MNTIEKVTSKQQREYYNPYAYPTTQKTVPLVKIPKNKTLVSKKRLSFLTATATIASALVILCFIEIIWMTKTSEDFYKKNMLLKNSAVVSQEMELVGVSGETVTFKNEKSTFIAQLPNDATLTLEEGQTYKISYNNGGLVYIGSVNK